MSKTTSHEEAEAWAGETLAGLSLERKVAQMVCEQMRGEYVSADDPSYVYLVELARDYGIGAFVVYGGTPQGTAHLVNRLQEEAEIPLMITADFEGGPGQQLTGATEFPANMALSAAGSEDLAYELGKAGAEEGRAVGIHVTYSPVVDIQTRPENPVLSVRSFGGDLELLGKMAGAYIRGYQENGMLATAKHYPGRGDVDLIPGTEYTVNSKPADRVEAEDFLAFKKAIEAGVTYIMSEHISVPAVTEGSDLPASVEGKLSSDWLREKLGFENILTSDDLWYAKVTERFGANQVCVMAVKAGHDALLKPADVPGAIQAVVEAVKSGEIPEAQIDASVKKILYWKARLNLHQNRFVDVARIPGSVGTRAHWDLAQNIADRSLTVIKNDGFFPTGSAELGRIVNISFQKRTIDPIPPVVSTKIKAAFPGALSFEIRRDSSENVYEAALEAARSADTLIISLFNQRQVYQDNGPLTDVDIAFIGRIVKRIPQRTVIMSYGNPYLADQLKDLCAAFVTGYGEGGFYGNSTIYADSFIRLLKGELMPRGKLPIHVSEEFPMGTGITY